MSQHPSLVSGCSNTRRGSASLCGPWSCLVAGSRFLSRLLAASASPAADDEAASKAQDAQVEDSELVGPARPVWRMEVLKKVRFDSVSRLTRVFGCDSSVVDSLDATPALRLIIPDAGRTGEVAPLAPSRAMQNAGGDCCRCRDPEMALSPWWCCCSLVSEVVSGSTGDTQALLPPGPSRTLLCHALYGADDVTSRAASSAVGPRLH